MSLCFLKINLYLQNQKMNKNSKYNYPIGMQKVEGQIGLETDSSLKMAKPIGFILKPTGFILKPTVPGKKPTGFILKPTVPGKKPTGFILKPTVPGKKPIGFILKPTVPGKKPIGFGFKPIGFWKSSFNSSENSNLYNSITI